MCRIVSFLRCSPQGRSVRVGAAHYYNSPSSCEVVGSSWHRYMYCTMICWGSLRSDEGFMKSSISNDVLELGIALVMDA